MHLFRVVSRSHGLLFCPVSRTMKEKMIRVMGREARDGPRDLAPIFGRHLREIDLSGLSRKSVVRAWEDRTFVCVRRSPAIG